MDSTSISLLQRIRRPDDDMSWQRFVNLYTPMIYRWGCDIGLPQTDAADMVQDVFVKILHAMPTFEYDMNGSFRAWLKTVTVNCGRDFLRRRVTREASLRNGNTATAVAVDHVEFISTSEYNDLLTRRALHCMQSEFEPITWKACWQFVVEGRSAADVAESLGITPNAVYLAKSRVLRRLRSELSGLIVDN